MTEPQEAARVATPPKKKRNPFLIIILVALGLLLVVGTIVFIAGEANKPEGLQESTGQGAEFESPKIEDPGQDPWQEYKTEGPADEPQGVAKFGQAYKYPNGLKVEVTKISKRSNGVIFTVKVTNGTNERFDATGVSVTASYGPDGENAECCMSNTDDMINGKILPGQAKSGTFGFDIPSSGYTNVQLEVTPDYSEFDQEPAIFQGSIK